MAERAQGHPWSFRGLFVLIALTLNFMRLLPLGGTAGAWPGPDLLLAVILAWTMRRPEYLPAWLLALVVLTEDMLLGRPPGLWTGLVVLAAEFLRSRVALTRELNFAVEWFLAGAVILALQLLNSAALFLAFVPQAGLGYALLQCLGTILCYPLVVFVSRFWFGVHKPATGELDARGRRL